MNWNILDIPAEYLEDFPNFWQFSQSKPEWYSLSRPDKMISYISLSYL